MKSSLFQTMMVLGLATGLLLAAPRAARAQGAIASGETRTGSITLIGGSDSWTFTANANDALVVRLGEISQSGNFVPRLRIFGPGATLLGTSSAAQAAEVAVTATTGGTYTAVVDNIGTVSATASYRISLARTGSPVTVSPGDEGGPLTNGAVHTGVIDVGDLDVWTVDATAGEALVVRMGETPGGSSLTCWLRLYSPAGTLVDYSYAASAAEVEVTTATTGAYLLVVGDNTSGWVGTGGYRLTLAKTGSPVTVSPGDEGGPLTNGAVHTGTIDLGDLDLWTVEATAGQALVLRMGQTDPGSSLTCWLRLYSPSGALIDYSYAASAAEVEVTAPASGTYLFVVGDNTSGWVGTGPYRITLAKTGSPVTVSPGDEGGPLTNGALQPGAIDLGDLDLWTVEASAGEALVVRMGESTPGSTLTCWLRLYSPTGALLDYSYAAAAAEVEVTAPATGSYLLVVGDNTSGWVGTGGYRLTLAKTGTPVTVSPGDEGGPMTNGAMHTGSIVVGDLDAWTFSATAGEALIIRMGETTPGSALTCWLRLYSPTGALLDYAYAASAAEVAVNAPATGAYLVVAGDNSSGWVGSGDYRLSLAKTGSPVTVSPGDEGGPLAYGLGTLNLPVGDLDAWTLTVHAGEAIVVHMSEVVAGSALTPWLRLYGPTGALLRSNSGAGAADVSMTAASSGTYLLVAADLSSGWAGSGTYQLNPAGTSGAPETPPPAALRLSPGFPNPFAARTTLAYEIPAPGAALLRLFDAQGRLVRTLVDAPDAAAGAHEVTWDGTDADGHAVTPGVYFARLESGGRPQVRKLILSR